MISFLEQGKEPWLVDRELTRDHWPGKWGVAGNEPVGQWKDCTFEVLSGNLPLKALGPLYTSKPFQHELSNDLTFSPYITHSTCFSPLILLSNSSSCLVLTCQSPPLSSLMIFLSIHILDPIPHQFSSSFVFNLKKAPLSPEIRFYSVLPKAYIL